MWLANFVKKLLSLFRSPRKLNPASSAPSKLEIIDYTDRGSNGKKYSTRLLKQIQFLVIHRIGYSTADELIEGFADTKKYKAGSYTGGKTPYHYFISYDGTVTQMLHLKIVGPAARALNRPGIQIALFGDFRKYSPNELQWNALIALCDKLRNKFPGVEIVGHTDKKNATSDASKECPGKYLDMEKLRNA